MLRLNKSKSHCEVYDETSRTVLSFQYDTTWHVILKQSMLAMGYDIRKLTLIRGYQGTSVWEIDTKPYKPPFELDDPDCYEYSWECIACGGTGVCPTCGDGACATCGVEYAT